MPKVRLYGTLMSCLRQAAVSAASSAAVVAASTATAASAAATLSSVDDYLSVVESPGAGASDRQDDGAAGAGCLPRDWGCGGVGIDIVGVGRWGRGWDSAIPLCCTSVLSPT
jgi:hypothetical protein